MPILRDLARLNSQMRVRPIEIPLFSKRMPCLRLTVYKVTVGETVFLFDCGVPWLASQILPHLDRLDYLVLTHAHIDHAGGIHVLLGRFPKAKLIADPAVIDWLNTNGLATTAGRFRPERLIRFARVQAHGDLSALQDFGIEPIETPGHCAVHHSFHLVPINEVLVGDAFAVRNGQPVGNKMFFVDREKLNASAAALQSLGAAEYWCCHGGGVSGEAVRSADLRV